MIPARRHRHPQRLDRRERAARAAALRARDGAARAGGYAFHAARRARRRHDHAGARRAHVRAARGSDAITVRRRRGHAAGRSVRPRRRRVRSTGRSCTRVGRRRGIRSAQPHRGARRSARNGPEIAAAVRSERAASTADRGLHAVAAAGDAVTAGDRFRQSAAAPHRNPRDTLSREGELESRVGDGHDPTLRFGVVPPVRDVRFGVAQPRSASTWPRIRAASGEGCSTWARSAASSARWAGPSPASISL